jgi:alkylhydroperoxidase family enzyme
MKPRVEYPKVAPGAMAAMGGLERYLADCGLDASLLDLVRLRASGESEQRLYALSAWHETPFYNARERAALAWTEALTLIADSHAPDEVYESVRQQFSEKELADLTLAIVAINGWHRLAIGFRTVPGTYPLKSHAMPNTARPVTR